MKVWDIVFKVVAALLAIAGIVVVIVLYGDKIAAWGKRMLNKLGLLQDEASEEIVDAEAEEVEQPEAAEETEADTAVVQAEDKDFEG